MNLVNYVFFNYKLVKMTLDLVTHIRITKNNLK